MKGNVEELFRDKLDMFPHLKKIRERLWSDDGKSRVSVMVGAGFSLNAKKIENSFKGMAVWNDIKNELTNDLSHRKDKTSSDVLEIGELYVKEYGRSILDEALKKAIPDNNYEPDQIHFDLIRLPWSDIYTTNYDTLLERANHQVFERNYQTIYDINDIPNSVQPRIVKLHGSFPSHRPFVFTKSDYEAYRVKFSPFVNMVQQSIMETTFVLLGFSGDDPNFTNWISWVSQNLGDHMPKIYMIGYDQKHRELELESKGITLIDFNEIYKDKINPYGEMFKDIFEFLSYKSKENKLEWPHRGFRNAGDIKYNRSTYPGWVVVPDMIRRNHSKSLIHYCHNIFKSRENIFIDDDLINHLNDILWFYDIFSIPLDVFVHQKLKQVLDSYKGSNEQFNIIPILFTLLREARLDFDDDEFEQYQTLLKKEELYIEQKHHLQYESIKYYVIRNDIYRVSALLKDWIIEDEHYVWGIKKGIIYLMINDLESSNKLFTKYIQFIRKLLIVEPDNFYLLSLESVVIHNLERINKAQGSSAKRLKELERNYCDTNKELIQTFLSISEHVNDLGVTESRGFDPGTKRIGSKFNNILSQEVIDAYAAIHLQEEYGLYYIRTKFDQALENVKGIYPNYSFNKLITNINKGRIEEIFTRTFVYNIKESQALALKTITINAFNPAASSIIDINLILEIMSRVYFVYPPEIQLEMDKIVLELLKRKNGFGMDLSDKIKKLIKRIIFAKNSKERKEFCENLILIENQSNPLDSYSFVEPFLVIISMNLNLSSLKINVSEEIIEDLLVKLPDQIALIRLTFLYLSDSIDTEKKEIFRAALQQIKESNKEQEFSKYLLQTTFDQILQESIGQNVNDFTSKDIPKIATAEGVIIDSSNLVDYFVEFRMLFIELVEKMDEGQLKVIYTKWFEKFILWWNSNKEALFLTASKERLSFIWNDNHFFVLILFLKNTLFHDIKRHYLDNEIWNEIDDIIKDINQREPEYLIYLIPSITKLDLSLKYNSYQFADLLWSMQGEISVNALKSVGDYLIFIDKGDIEGDKSPLLNEITQIIKYGLVEKKIVAFQTMEQLIRFSPSVIDDEYCNLLTKILNGYLQIFKNESEYRSQIDFELLGSISLVVTQLINKRPQVKNQLIEWKEYIVTHRLPEVRTNADLLES